MCDPQQIQSIEFHKNQKQKQNIALFGPVVADFSASQRVKTKIPETRNSR